MIRTHLVLSGFSGYPDPEFRSTWLVKCILFRFDQEDYFITLSVLPFIISLPYVIRSSSPFQSGWLLLSPFMWVNNEVLFCTSPKTYFSSFKGGGTSKKLWIAIFGVMGDPKQVKNAAQFGEKNWFLPPGGAERAISWLPGLWKIGHNSFVLIDRAK